ncbi:MAG: exostosin family protein [Planctomycetia bacterium]
MRRGKDIFTITDVPEEADFFLPPTGWQPGGSRQVEQMAEVAHRHGKPLLVFFCSDSDEKIAVENAIVYRTSMYRATRKPWEHSWPIWTCDILGSHGGGSMHDRRWTVRPSVGYCGYVDYRTGFEWLQRSIRRQISPSMSLRGEAVRALQASRDVDPRLILRRRFGGGATGQQRDEFARNLLESDYALVARGNGNFSFRLYEAMSAGTIPVFLDTDCCLPFDDTIPYRDLFVWVPAADVHRIGDYVAAHHARLDDRSFNERRRSIRDIYDRFLSPLGFHRELAARLAARLVRTATAAPVG